MRWQLGTTATPSRKSRCSSTTNTAASRSTRARSVWIEYAYTVGDDKWGNWFQGRPPAHQQLEVQPVSGAWTRRTRHL
ncbi:hypothetical protein O1L55_03645 [Streptomyces albulus]|nr:hypothetical protein [Streptomyces noursei]